MVSATQFGALLGDLGRLHIMKGRQFVSLLFKCYHHEVLSLLSPGCPGTHWSLRGWGPGHALVVSCLILYCLEAWLEVGEGRFMRALQVPLPGSPPRFLLQILAHVPT